MDHLGVSCLYTEMDSWWNPLLYCKNSRFRLFAFDVVLRENTLGTDSQQLHSTLQWEREMFQVPNLPNDLGMGRIEDPWGFQCY